MLYHALIVGPPPHERSRMEAVRKGLSMPYEFLVDTYETERIKVVSVWSEFADEDLPVRPRPGDPRPQRARADGAPMVSEGLWFAACSASTWLRHLCPSKRPVWNS